MGVYYIDVICVLFLAFIAVKMGFDFSSLFLSNF